MNDKITITKNEYYNLKLCEYDNIRLFVENEKIICNLLKKVRSYDSYNDDIKEIHKEIFGGQLR